MADIFLSYSREDSEVMQRLYQELQAAGFAVWIDHSELVAGTSSWQRAIEQAIDESTCMIVILSPDAKASKWVEIEISWAEHFGRRIFPVLARGDVRSAVPFSLITAQRVDIQKVAEALIPALRQHLRLAEPQPKPEKKPVPITFDWVSIPAGSFQMGSDKTKDKDARENELPQHTVYLPAYQIARVPVTNAQYKQFVDAKDYEPPRHWNGGQIPKGKEQHPVVRVSWHDAMAFCDWVGVRLPTEAEWEKAASWDAQQQTKRIYPWGDKFDANLCNSRESGHGDTTPVGSYPKGASPYGVLDIAGNVWEWTADWYDKDYYHHSHSPKHNPTGPEDGRYRALRGGSWLNYVNLVRCASRDYFLDDFANFGFRVVVSSPGS